MEGTRSQDVYSCRKMMYAVVGVGSYRAEV